MTTNTGILGDFSWESSFGSHVQNEKGIINILFKKYGATKLNDIICFLKKSSNTEYIKWLQSKV